MKTFRTVLFLVVILTFGISATSIGQQSKPWVVPANFKSMKNPVASNDASIKAGQALYNKNCMACHGKTGLGDGPKSKGLKTKVASFMSTEFTSQTDGDWFYKSKTGRGDMPKYEGKIDDNGLWQVVTYLRTLKK